MVLCRQCTDLWLVRNMISTIEHILSIFNCFHLHNSRSDKLKDTRNSTGKFRMRMRHKNLVFQHKSGSRRKEHKLQSYRLQRIRRGRSSHRLTAHRKGTSEQGILCTSLTSPRMSRRQSRTAYSSCRSQWHRLLQSTQRHRSQHNTNHWDCTLELQNRTPNPEHTTGT
jgi:hypothetical protein